MPRSVFTDANKIVVEALISARKSAGLRQEDVAERLGKPQSFVSRVESGQRRLDILEFYALARALGANPIKLFDRIVAKLPADVRV